MTIDMYFTLINLLKIISIFLLRNTWPKCASFF